MSAEATLHRTVSLSDESETVGIEDSIAKITRGLSDEGPSHFQARGRIAVVGMGGTGKTHLLTHVSKTERGKFDKSAWLTISQSYSPKALQKRLGREIFLPIENGEEARECLRRRRSLKIFRPNGVPPKELEALAREIEGKCRRLPLAIKKVGASASRQQLPTDLFDAVGVSTKWIISTT